MQSLAPSGAGPHVSCSERRRLPSESDTQRRLPPRRATSGGSLQPPRGAQLRLKTVRALGARGEAGLVVTIDAVVERLQIREIGRVEALYQLGRYFSHAPQPGDYPPAQDDPKI